MTEDHDRAGQAPDKTEIAVRDTPLTTLDLRLAPLYIDLAKAQGAFPVIPKNRTATIRPQSGEPWSYKYSDPSVTLAMLG